MSATQNEKRMISSIIFTPDFWLLDFNFPSLPPCYGTLGYALPAAVGAWLGSRDAGESNPVVCLIGDGGLQFT